MEIEGASVQQTGLETRRVNREEEDQEEETKEEGEETEEDEKKANRVKEK